MCDSSGYIFDEDGIDLPLIQQIKEIERKRIKEYAIENHHQNTLKEIKDMDSES